MTRSFEQKKIVTVSDFKDLVRLLHSFGRNMTRFFEHKRLSWRWELVEVNDEMNVKNKHWFIRTDNIPANFSWDICVRFISWECWDFWRRHDHFRRFPKKSEVFRRSSKSSEDVRSLRTCINASSLQVLFTSKIRDREEGIVIYSFYTWFLFLTWVWVNTFVEIVSSKTATTHIFQSGVRNWPAGARSKFSTCRRDTHA